MKYVYYIIIISSVEMGSQIHNIYHVYFLEDCPKTTYLFVLLFADFIYITKNLEQAELNGLT